MVNEQRFGRPGCSTCAGTGWLHGKSDLHQVRCVCNKTAMQMYLGPELLSVPTCLESPLFIEDEATGEVSDDVTGRNAVLKGTWAEIMPHLKWALICKGIDFRYKILTDEKLKTVYVGAEAYTSRARSKREDVATFNSLNDVVGSDISLLIIRLGHLGYKNVAMPGVLKEALMLREVSLRPTWLVESPDAPFVYGHFAFSEDVFDYILKRFEIFDLSGDSPRRDFVVPQGYGDVDNPAPEPIKAEPAEEPAVERSKVQIPKSRLSPLDNIEMPGEGGEKKPKKWNTKRKGGYRE